MQLDRLISIAISTIAITLQCHGITKNEALEVVKNLYQGYDCDYYHINDHATDVWTFFVDAEPLKGWEHDCYVVTIPKNAVNKALVDPQIQKLKMPPSLNMTPAEVINRYGDNAFDKPQIIDNTARNVANPVANRTYAVILSGGINKNANYERYWNDCSFIYQSLTKTYSIPNDNIFVLMADGTDPADDMRLYNGGYASSPLDLDGDGLNDIRNSATKTNIATALNEISKSITADDHLFFYVIDHGGSDDMLENSYICLWEGEKLYDHELASMLSPFLKNNVTVNVVLGQCYSGGFVSDLIKEGCVVTAACKGDESSWACTDRPYDEFVYHWTCAVNKCDPYGNTVSVEDSDGDGIISMHEAFTYAKMKDRRNETPQFWSMPSTVGLLAFDHLIPTIGLYIKDNWNDFAIEPNRSTQNFWDSPYIWVKNQSDKSNEFSHENPYYTDDHQTAFVYVKVQNYGKKIYPGRGKFLHLHWAKASTEITIGDWIGSTTNIDGSCILGSEIKALHIDSVIAPGKSVNIEYKWELQSSFPNETETIDGSQQHVCLLARINNTILSDAFTGIDTGQHYDVIGDPTIAQKNVSIIPAYQTPYGVRALVKNSKTVESQYSLEFVPRTYYDAEIFDRASIEMELGPRIYSAWRRGGSKLSNAKAKSISVSNPDNFVVELLATNSKVDGIKLTGGEMDVVTMKFDFVNPSSEIQVYTYDLIQRDASGTIVGGETFKIVAPISSAANVQVYQQPLGATNYQLRTDDSFKSYVWHDSEGNKIAVGNSTVVSPASECQTYAVTGITEFGEMGTSTVTLSPPHGIEDIYPSASGNGEFIVKLKTLSPANSSITVSSISNGKILYHANCEECILNHTIGIIDNPEGIVLVTYSVDGVVVDSKKICLRY